MALNELNVYKEYMKIDIVQVTDNSLRRCFDHRWFIDHNVYEFFVLLFVH